MYRVYFDNFHYASEREFGTLENAVKFAANTTFDCTIFKGDPYAEDRKPVGFYSFFRGFRHYHSAQTDVIDRTSR